MILVFISVSPAAGVGRSYNIFEVTLARHHCFVTASATCLSRLVITAVFIVNLEEQLLSWYLEITALGQKILSQTNHYKAMMMSGVDDTCDAGM